MQTSCLMSSQMSDSPANMKNLFGELGRPEHDGSLRVLFYLVDGFSMMAFSSAIEPLRAANRLLGRPRYVWMLAAERVGPARASNGIEIYAPFAVENAPTCDLIVVVASLFPTDYSNSTLFAWLRSLRAQGQMIGAISNGSFLLAKSGVLRDSRATIHWEMADQFAESFPDITVSSDLYCWDKGILTAAGGAAAMDMMLALILELDGEVIAMDVADQFLHGQIRPSSHLQRQDTRWRYQVTDKRVMDAIEIMKAHISDPVRIASIAQSVGVSERQFGRMFALAVGKAPSDFYLNLRLHEARSMLLGSTDTLENIAERCGFSSHAHFSRAFKAHYGTAPSNVRQNLVRGHVGFMQGDGGTL